MLDRTFRGVARAGTRRRGSPASRSRDVRCHRHGRGLMTEALTAVAFRRRLLGEAVRANQPIACVFEITPRCNLRCGFCFVALDPYRGPYLDTAQVREALNRLADAGILFLTLTGGEICSRRDFPEIYRHAVDRGMLVTLFTNGTMLTPRIV